MEEEDKFELWPVISPSDKEFREKIGEETWEKMKSLSFRDSGYKCCGDVVLNLMMLNLIKY